MKRILLGAMILALCSIALPNFSIAQINTPAPSPFCKTIQTVGLSEVTVEYSRPSKKGRELFVDVEEWGTIWRTGANASTKVTFSDDMMVEGNKVPAGTYAIYSIPDKSQWTIMLYNDLTMGGNTSKYDESKEQLRFKVKTEMMPMEVETFTIHFGELSSDEATMALIWGKYYVPVKLKAEVDNKVMKQIDAAMGGPDRNEYYTAARYYYDNNKDMDQALTWIRKANDQEAKFWQLRLEAQILAKMGKYDDAIMKANKSTELAKADDNSDYPKMNQKSIDEWKSMKMKK